MKAVSIILGNLLIMRFPRLRTMARLRDSATSRNCKWSLFLFNHIIHHNTSLTICIHYLYIHLILHVTSIPLFIYHPFSPISLYIYYTLLISYIQWVLRRYVILLCIATNRDARKVNRKRISTSVCSVSEWGVHILFFLSLGFG